MKSVVKTPDVLLLTGCVRPVDGQAYLVLTNPEERLSQYRASITYYLQRTKFPKVIFCDNSGWTLDFGDLTKLAAEHEKEFEVLSFCGNTHETRIRGKGYGEGEIVAHALTHSRWAKDIRHFVKVTGRLIVHNMEDIRKRLDTSRFYINRLLLRNNPEVLDTRLYAISTELYNRHFLALHKSIGVDFNLEQAFTECIHRESLPFKCFPRYPEFRGICGGDGMVYGQESSRLLWAFRWASACGIFNARWFSKGLAKWRMR